MTVPHYEVLPLRYGHLAGRPQRDVLTWPGEVLDGRALCERLGLLPEPRSTRNEPN